MFIMQGAELFVPAVALVVSIINDFHISFVQFKCHLVNKNSLSEIKITANKLTG